MKQKVVLTDVPILTMAAEGKTIARHPDGRIIFVTGAVPGDRADIRLLKTRKDYCEGQLVELRYPSPDRADPFCRHFGICGGCKWQHLYYTAPSCLQATTYRRSPAAHWQIGFSAPPPHLASRPDALLPQQVGIYLFQSPLAVKRRHGPHGR